MLIMVAAQADGDEVIALWEQCGLTRPWNDPREDFQRALTSAQSVVLVARADDRIVGSVMAGDDGHRGWLYYLAVEPSDQRKGLGRDLVKAAEAWLAEVGQSRVRLMVRSENQKVMSFYESLGYADQDCAVLGRTTTES